MRLFRNNAICILVLTLGLSVVVASCQNEAVNYNNEFRLQSIPESSVKMTPETDKHKPIMHSIEFSEPIPVKAISSAGAEDSAFIPKDRDELYFMFVKDVSEDPSAQVQDIVNGIWVSKMKNGEWQPPELVILQNTNKLALNGAQFVYKNEMYFVSAREGYDGLNWFRAELINGKWKNWDHISFSPDYEVGEFHIHNGVIYFHSYMEGGKGDLDIWSANIKGNELSNLQNLNFNTDGLEGWPYISPDGQELWYTGQYNGVAAIYRMKKTDNGWGEKELIVSNFAGEPTLDSNGNLYFTHHYFDNGVMIEADIFVAKRR